MEPDSPGTKCATGQLCDVNIFNLSEPVFFSIKWVHVSL